MYPNSHPLKGYSAYLDSGKTDKAARSPLVASQVRMPSLYLKGESYVDVLRPDALHYKLTITRVRMKKYIYIITVFLAHY